MPTDAPLKSPFTECDAERIARDLYGINATAQPLPSYDDQNFLLRASSDEQYVLKISHVAEKRPIVEGQNAMLKHLRTTVSPTDEAIRECCFSVPNVVTSHDGHTLTTVSDSHGSNHFVRLITYLPGTPMAQCAKVSETLLLNLGRSVASMNRSLESFAHPGLNRDWSWDLKRADEVSQFVDAHVDPQRRDIIRQILACFQESCRDTLESLPHGTIHGDVNDYNLIVDENDPDRIAGLIDFGDAIHTAIVCEVAITVAYAMLRRSDPVAAGALVMKGYTSVRPLSQVELSLVAPLALTRLAVSVTQSVRARALDPANSYISVTEAPAWKVLELIDALPHGAFASALMRSAATRETPNDTTPPASTAKTLKARRRFTSSALSLSYQTPLEIVRGEGTYLFDTSGRRFIDCVNNVCHVGHCHPRIIEAAHQQMQMLNTNTRYLHDNLNEYARRLSETMPDGLDVCFFVNSGSEANDLALRLARCATGKQGVCVINHAYHGNTSSLIGISPYKFDGPGGIDGTSTTTAGKGTRSHFRSEHVRVAPSPDTYRGIYRASDSNASTKYADAVEEHAHDAACFFCESLPGCAGQIIPPAGFLAQAFDRVRALGGVTIADEVQVGFGRVGSGMWAFDAQGARPDIVTLGKPIGNGHPLGAVVTTRQIADAFDNGMEYFNTFGGNPVSCAVGLAVLGVIEDEGLIEHAAAVGTHLIDALRTLQNDFELIGDVRGMGLFIGIELVRDQETLEPAASEATAIIEAMKDRGILLSVDGPHHNVIKIKPPMVFSEADADEVVDQLRAVLSKQ